MDKRKNALPGSEYLTTLILVIIDVITFCLNKKMLWGVNDKGTNSQVMIIKEKYKPNCPITGLIKLSTGMTNIIGMLNMRNNAIMNTGSKKTWAVPVEKSRKECFLGS